MRRFDLWLALRLLAGQKLRAATLFCGMLASSFLVDAFGQLGGWLLREVCGEGARARFDGTFGVLAVLAAVLVLLVCFCAYVLLRNLYTVTLVQRQKSLIRLRMRRTEEKETGRECRTKEEETCRAGRASSPQAPVRQAAYRANPSPQNTRAEYPSAPGQLLPVYGAGIPRGRPRALPEDHGGVCRGGRPVRSGRPCDRYESCAAPRGP